MSDSNLQQVKISVIVPVYKAAGTLNACVKSIQEQTYRNIEIILVDDGSPDVSGEMCDEFAKKDHRIKVIHQKNAGVSAARNSGIKEASADYLCFVDSDDEITHDCVEKLVNAKLESDAQLIIGGMSLYHKHETKYVYETDRICSLSDFSYDEFTDMFGKWIMAPLHSKLFQKKIITENNLHLKEGLVCGEDHLFVFEYLKYCEKICFIDANIYRYHCYNNNGQARFFPLEGQIKIFDAKMHLLEKYCSKEYVQKYCADRALHNLNVRVNYLAKKKKDDSDELQQAYNYYWQYIYPFINDSSFFNQEDYEWLERNKKALLDGDVKSLFKDLHKRAKAKKNARKKENIKEVLRMPLKAKIKFVLKKLLRF